MWACLGDPQEGLRHDPFEPCHELRRPAVIKELGGFGERSCVLKLRGGGGGDGFRDVGVDGEHELAPGVGEGGGAVRLLLLEGGAVDGADEGEGRGVGDEAGDGAGGDVGAGDVERGERGELRPGLGGRGPLEAAASGDGEEAEGGEAGEGGGGCGGGGGGGP